jgi:hypothetical protein
MSLVRCPTSAAGAASAGAGWRKRWARAALRSAPVAPLPWLVFTLGARLDGTLALPGLAGGGPELFFRYVATVEERA